MKLRTVAELINRLDESLAWRKKELTTLKLMVSQTKKEHERKLALRSAVPILYAHWEGFIKLSAGLYLEFVSRQKLKYSELETNFIAIACHLALKDSTSSSQAHIHRQVVDFIMLNQADKSNIKFKDVINTESTLSSKVLINILNTIGIPVSNFWVDHFPLVDTLLLKNRNSIAHGEQVYISNEDYLALHQFTVNALEYFKTELENSAATGRYRRVA